MAPPPTCGPARQRPPPRIPPAAVSPTRRTLRKRLTQRERGLLFRSTSGTARRAIGPLGGVRRRRFRNTIRPSYTTPASARQLASDHSLWSVRLVGPLDEADPVGTCAPCPKHFWHSPPCQWPTGCGSAQALPKYHRPSTPHWPPLFGGHLTHLLHLLGRRSGEGGHVACSLPVSMILRLSPCIVSDSSDGLANQLPQEPYQLLFTHG